MYLRVCSALPGQNAQETCVSCGQGSGWHVQSGRLIQRCVRLHHRSAKIQVFALVFRCGYSTERLKHRVMLCTQ